MYLGSFHQGLESTPKLFCEVVGERLILVRLGGPSGIILLAQRIRHLEEMMTVC